MNNLFWLIPSLALSLQACGSSKPADTPLAKTEIPGDEAPTHEEAVQVELGGITDTFATSLGDFRMAPIWHGTVAFALNGKVVLVDPWSKAPAGRIPKADLILLTDIHPDHLDAAAIEMARKPTTVIVGPAAVAEQLEGVVVLVNGESRTELGIVIDAVPMYNIRRGPEEGALFHDKGRGNGYVLGVGDKKIYLSGDTECTEEMRALRDIDVALVSMNLPYTMPPEEAAQCIKAFRPKVVIPYHYRGSDLDVLAKELANEADIELRERDFYAP